MCVEDCQSHVKIILVDQDIVVGEGVITECIAICLDYVC